MQELESLQNIFKDRIFKIPDYQRGYAWTTRQLKDFWEDVVNLPLDRNHYTGLLTLKKLNKRNLSNWNDEQWLLEDRGYRPFHIVDGQQRITTFVIFIQAISELLKQLPDNKDKNDEDVYLGSFSLKAIKESYLVVEKPPQFIIKTYKFGYEVDNPSFKFLRHRIFQELDSGTIQETFYTLNLENAKTFFKENLYEFYQKYGFTEIESLYKKITQNLMFNVYEISDDFDVFVAFETMNNRGKKLSNLELLKNRLIYLTTLYDEDELKPDERVALREKINDAWKEIYYQLGRNKKYPLNDDEFLVAHWIMYFQYTREKGDDYVRFLLDQKFTPQNIYSKTEIKISSLEEFEEIREDDNIDQEDVENNGDEAKTVFRSKLSPKDIEKYVNSLKSAAVHWYNTHHPVNNPDLTEEERLWIDRLNRIGIVYFRPLVTVSFLSDNIKEKQRIKLFKAIERFIFIAFRLSRAFSSYRNSEFYRAARQLRNGELSINDIVKRLVQRMDYCFYKDEGETKDLFNLILSTCVVTCYIEERNCRLGKLRSLAAGELVAHQELRQIDMAKAPENFAETVKEVRQQLGLSQEELAHELGVSFSTINRWENSKTVPFKLARRQFEALL
jgi:DNA-binding transcriptional regulator YiaG